MSGNSDDLLRYRENYLKEQEGIALYQALAKAERDPSRAAIFEKLAEAESRHASRWARLLKEHGARIPEYRPGLRVRFLAWVSRRVGTQPVLSVVTGLETSDQNDYASQAEAEGLPAAERSHGRTLRLMEQRGGASTILQAERWHRASYGGSLRAAVFGANDGLISNFSLVMGVTGAGVESRFILLTGVAGLLAGAFSMAAGEYVSVRSQRELYEQQLALEEQELKTSPEEEQEELALIYQAKGIPADQAVELARKILMNHETAIDTLAREELGLDPSSLGSPWSAALSSFVAFAVGALIPVVPYIAWSGPVAFGVSAAVCGLALFVVGALISVFTGRNPVWTGLRMVGIGALAASVTFLIGKALGVSVAG
jgi:VIT1/CCC1 family predicted Fe2+/Mn2+ transporter